jgi:hypothetical protein
MRKAALALPVLALSLAGCGGGGGGGGGGGSGGGDLGVQPGLSGTTASFVLRDFSITPGTVKLPKPGTYTFKAANEGAQTHNLEVKGAGLTVKGHNIGFGATTTFAVKFTKAGKYQLFCPLDSHRQLGMSGTITVGGA